MTCENLVTEHQLSSMLSIACLLSLLVASQAVHTLTAGVVAQRVPNAEVSPRNDKEFEGQRLQSKPNDHLQESAATHIPTSDTPASRHQGYMMGLQSVESFVPTSLLPENASIVTHSKIYRQVLLARHHRRSSMKHLAHMQRVGTWYGTFH